MKQNNQKKVSLHEQNWACFSQSFGMGKETFKRHFHYEGILIKYQIGLIRCTVKFFFRKNQNLNP